MSTAGIDFAELEELTMRAFLATTEFDSSTLGKWRMSDQARRVGLLLSRVTFGHRPRPREGIWVRSSARIAECLEMDPSDCRKAIDRLITWGLLLEEARGEWFYYTLTPGRLTLHQRALEARDAWSRLEAAQDEMRELLERSLDERKDGGLLVARAAADRERAMRTAAGSAPIYPRVGGSGEGRDRDGETGLRRPEREAEASRETPRVGVVNSRGSPRWERGDSPEFTNPPSRAGADARNDSLTDRQIAIRNESGKSGAVALECESGKFYDRDLNRFLDRIVALERHLDPISRRAWIGRVSALRDEKCMLETEIGEVEHKVRVGESKSPRGLLFSNLRKACRAIGREFRMFL